jgi:hypothetical protein
MIPVPKRYHASPRVESARPEQIAVRISESMRRLILVCVAILGLAFALVAGSAGAEEVSESYAYVERAEPICQTFFKRLDTGRRPIYVTRPRSLASRAHQFTRNARLLGKTGHELRAVPEPRADESKLAQWLADLKAISSTSAQIGVALNPVNVSLLKRLEPRFLRDLQLAEQTVAVFHFHYCRAMTELKVWNGLTMYRRSSKVEVMSPLGPDFGE